MGRESCAHFSWGPGRTSEVLKHPHSVAHGDSSGVQHKLLRLLGSQGGEGAYLKVPRAL